MKENIIKEFTKYFFLVLAVYFINETFKYYLPLDFSGKYGFIAGCICAFLVYIMSK